MSELLWAAACNSVVLHWRTLQGKLNDILDRSTLTWTMIDEHTSGFLAT